MKQIDANRKLRYVRIPLLPKMQERSEAERRAIASPAAGFDEDRGGSKMHRKGEDRVIPQR